MRPPFGQRRCSVWWSAFSPIGWIVLNVIFLYRVTVETGRFELLKRAIGG